MRWRRVATWKRALGRGDEAKQDYDRVVALNATGWALQAAQAGLAALTAGAATPSAAGADPNLDPAGDQASCKGFSGKAALAACGRAIASGKFTGGDLLDLYKQRASADEEIKNFNQAIVDYGGMIRINPDIPDLFEKRANAYMNVNDPDHAIADYGEAIRRAPGAWVLLSNRGRAYFGKNDFDHAIADFTAALALMQAPGSTADPAANVGTLVLRGLAYTAKQDFDHATADLGEAIRLDPGNAIALVRARRDAGGGRSRHRSGSGLQQGLEPRPRRRFEATGAGRARGAQRRRGPVPEAPTAIRRSRPAAVPSRPASSPARRSPSSTTVAADCCSTRTNSINRWPTSTRRSGSIRSSISPI